MKEITVLTLKGHGLKFEGDHIEYCRNSRTHFILGKDDELIASFPAEQILGVFIKESCKGITHI